MARAKSTSGKGRTSKAQTGVSNPTGIPDVNAAASTRTGNLGGQARDRNRSDKTVRRVLETKSETKMFEVRKTNPQECGSDQPGRRDPAARLRTLPATRIPVRAARPTIGSLRNAKSCSVTISRALKRVLWSCG